MACCSVKLPLAPISGGLSTAAATRREDSHTTTTTSFSSAPCAHFRLGSSAGTATLVLKPLIATRSSRPVRQVRRQRQARMINGGIWAATSDVGEKTEKYEKLKEVKLYGPDGTETSLAGLWENRTAVVAFGRHFGCLLCKKRAALLQSRKAEMDAAGVALILVAPGVTEQARQFIEQTKFTGEVYADPDHKSYDALEFSKGVGSIFNLKSATRLVQATLEGFRQDWKLSFYGDTVKRGGWQQGGILVAGPGADAVRYLFKDAEAGDEPKLEDVMSACCA